MEFALTEQQTDLATTARDFLAGPRSTGDSWPTLVDLGWLDPKLGMVERGVLAEQCGYAGRATAWVTTVALAAPVLEAAGRTPSRSTTLARTMDRIPGGVAAAVALSDGDLFLIDLDPVECRTSNRTWDPARPDISIPAVDGGERLSIPDVPAALATARRTGLAIFACEAVGIARRALDIAVAHAKQREQFGRPIGANQAVSHRLADVYASIELARSLAYRAVWSVGDGDADTLPECLAASLAARRAAVAATESCVQTLGAIGFTWEHEAHMWYRRALWHHGFDGYPDDLRAELAESLLADRQH